LKLYGAGARQRDETARHEAAMRSAAEATKQAEATERIVRAELAESQLAANHFFGSFLEAARQLPPSASAERARLMADGYGHFSRFIEKNESRPEMAVACLRARCHLAEIKTAMGAGGEAAVKFEDARARIDQWLAANPAHAESGGLRVMAAECALSAALLRQTGPPVPESVRSQLREAVAAVDRAAPPDSLPPRLRRRTAEARLALARALHAAGPAEFPEALTLLNQAAESMNFVLAEAKSSRPEDRLFLAGVYFERGRVERAARKTEAALATQVQTAELLLECGNQPDALYQLALCYGETGEMLDANAEHHDAARAHGEAVKILSDLVRNNPQRTDWQLQLATRYANIAQLVRDHSEPDRALDYQKGAVQLLDVLASREPGNALLASQLARRKADLSDLLTALGKKAEALVEAREAIALLDKLGAPGKPISAPEFTLILSAAQTYGVAGHVTEEARQTAEAAQCFSKAISHYEALASARAGDDEIERGLTWSRMRLAKLKN
jgi:tetratricopeptide (TPR) repeat protein